MIEVIKCKGVVFQKPEEVDMREMQRDILAGLLNARVELHDTNVLTVNAVESIIDALFYLVKER